MPVTTPISSEMVAPSTDTRRADQSPGTFQPSLCPVTTRYDERTDRVRQVEDQQGAEPAERARRPARRHDLKRLARSLGTPDPVTFAGETTPNLSAFSSAWPMEPRRNLTKASAAGRWGAPLTIVIV